MRSAAMVGMAWVAVCLATMPAAAQTLGSELSGLVEHNPQIQSKTKSVSAAVAGIGVARAGYFPTVKIAGDGGFEHDDTQTRRETQGESFNRGRETSSVVVTQHLFDGHATDSAVDSATISHEVANSELRNTRQTVLLEGVSAYVAVIKAMRMIELAHDSERKVHEQLNLEDERVEKGAGLASDVLAAKQRLQVAKEARVRYEGEFQAAVAKYTQVFGHAPDLAALKEPPVPKGQVPASLDEALALAAKDNPTIETAMHNVALANEKRRGAEAGNYPSVDLVGRGDYNDGNAATTGLSRTGSVLVTVTWELFSGFKTASQTMQAAHEHAASQDNRLYADRKVAEAVRTAWYKLKTARERLDLLDTAATLAEELWQAMRLRHNAGKATITEVLDSETKINDARISYAAAYYDMVSATYELLGALGRMEADAAAGPVPATPPAVGVKGSDG